VRRTVWITLDVQMGRLKAFSRELHSGPEPG
jgi:hypothetical protein